MLATLVGITLYQLLMRKTDMVPAVLSKGSLKSHL